MPEPREKEGEEQCPPPDEELFTMLAMKYRVVLSVSGTSVRVFSHDPVAVERFIREVAPTFPEMAFYPH